MQESCGIAGISLKEGSCALPLYYVLYSLQHRGQESAGITVHNGERQVTVKGMGLVPEVFRKRDLTRLAGSVGIGHVRYSTTGDSVPGNSQPLIVSYRNGEMALAHNGNIVNSQTLREELEREGNVFHSDTDTEVIAHLLVRELLEEKNIVDAVRSVMRRLTGSYSLAILLDDTLVVVRDPLGFKPLVLGRLEKGYIAASESAALDVIGAELVRDVWPGEMLVFQDGEYHKHRLYRHKNTAHCVFEYIYFSRPDSILEGQLVYDVRMRIGQTLAQEHPVDADIVSPVPDSGITFAIGYSQESGIQYLEGLIKNRYIGRTFIMPGQRLREVAVRLKLNTIQPNIKNRDVILVDDSIVRGTTSRRIIDLLRQGGARKVHMRIGSPPIVSPCYLGIDMATREELIAAYKTTSGVEALINADSLGYISIDGLVNAIGIPAQDLCMGCLTAVYPVEIPGEQSISCQLKITEF